MTTFMWLIVGHLLGDWVLQNDWMAKGKKRGLFTIAGSAHFTIYTIATVGAFWLSRGTDIYLGAYVLLGASIYISHWLIDSTQLVERWMRFYRQSHVEVVRLMVDQTLHILVLAALAVLV